MSDLCDGADYKVLWQQMQGRAEAAEAEVELLKHERAIIDKVLRDSNLDATRWFMMEALSGEGEK